MPSGGSRSAGPAAAAGGPAAAAEKKEEKKEEVEEVDMGNLFGGDDDGYWDLLPDYHSLWFNYLMDLPQSCKWEEKRLNQVNCDHLAEFILTSFVNYYDH